MKACEFVLESHKDKPLQTPRAIWLKRFSWLIMAIGTISVLHAGMLVKIPELGAGLYILWGITVISGSHLAYLYLVLWLLVFREPVERLHWQQVIFPSLLCLGYFFYALTAYVEYANIYGNPLVFDLLSPYITRITVQNKIEVISLACFFSLYLLWCFRDICEWSTNKNPRRKVEIVCWWWIELISLCAIGGTIYFKIISDIDEIHIFFSKNTAILLSLSLWFIITVIENLAKEGGYRDIYDGYLKFNKVEQFKPEVVTETTIIPDGTILDIGCGNGLRFKEIATWLKINEKIANGKYEIVGYDNDETWRYVYENNVQEKHSKFITNIDSINWNNIKLIVLSHILYKPNTTKEIMKYIDKCNEGTIVLIRGASPTSFFSIVSNAFSRRFLFPEISHLWYKQEMMKLTKKCCLCRIDNTKNDLDPDAIVKQKYELNEDSIQRAGDILSYLYQKIAGDMAVRYFNDVFKISGLKHLPNEDLIYLYKINRNL
jgi:hypothetical protein